MEDILSQGFPLHSAARAGNIQAIEFLIVKGTDVDEQDLTNGSTPILLATEMGSTEVITTLINTGLADVTIPNWNGYTPLHNAAMYCDVSIIRALISKGANPNAQACNDYGKVSPLHLAVQREEAHDIERVIQELIVGGALVNAIDNSSRTPLHYAAKNDMIEAVKELVANNADVNALDTAMMTPIHDALANPELLDALLGSAKLDLSIGYQGNTVLHFAAQGGHLKAIEAFVAKGADVNAVTVLGPLAIKRAEGSKATNTQGQTPLHLAAQNGLSSIIKLLIAKGANVNAVSVYDTPLRYAVNRNHGVHVVELLRSGADVNFTDKDGRTVLHDAARNRNCGVMKMLIDAGADVDDKDGDALVIEAEFGNFLSTELAGASRVELFALLSLEGAPII